MKLNVLFESTEMHDEDVFGSILGEIFKLAATGQRDPELEKEIINSNDSCSAFYYAADVIKGRWPEVEAIIKQNVGWWGYYKRKFGI